jgi:environmental stress-induced protein Ves
MAEIFNNYDFKVMPWKNGGGVTTELYKIPDPQNPSNFLFRLSKAAVETSGPFSLFPNTERTLILLKGHGFHLKAPAFSKTLSSSLEAFTFSGDDAIICTLINGSCVDFNIMIKGHYGRAKSSIFKGVVPQGSTACDLAFIYDIDKENLHFLKKGEAIHLDPLEKSTLILIEVNLK